MQEKGSEREKMEGCREKMRGKDTESHGGKEKKRERETIRPQ